MYRVEHVIYGNGPYCLAEDLPRPVPIVVDEDKLHPNTDFYNLPEIVGANCIFGFRNLNQLKIWFSIEERDALHRHSYVIRQYELDRGAIKYSDASQIAVDRRKISAVRAQHISLIEI